MNQNQEKIITGKIISINGPIIFARIPKVKMRDLVKIGPDEMLGEIIEFIGDKVVIQVFEDTIGLKPGDLIISTGVPLSVELGPGLLGVTFDGIQRRLELFKQKSPFLKPLQNLTSLDREKKWKFKPIANKGDQVIYNSILGEVKETGLITIKIMVPYNIQGKLKFIKSEGEYSVDEEIAEIETEDGVESIKMFQIWPVRKQRPFIKRIFSTKPLITGLRVLDFLFPIKLGGAAAVPGGFGAGKTMLQHSLAKWSAADVIVYIGCGERGNEMTQVLEEFPKLIDPRSGRPLIERTILIANTSNMPVTARESSIYTGITIAEYFRDMGYNVAIMADSTSRWAEALREISGRLEEIPAEEGFPSYLSSRLAEFYERAGLVQVHPDREGSVTAIGAVSPQGGDFSEPVTQNTKRFVRAFWALDKDLAGARHFPSVSWIESYSEYVEEIKDWWQEYLDLDWYGLRKKAVELFQLDKKLQQIVKLVGPDALPDKERIILLVTELLKVAYLQQNAFDEIDMYCVPEKQIKMFQIILDFFEKAKMSIEDGIPFHQIQTMEILAKIKRMKLEYSNKEVDKMDEIFDAMKQEFNSLREFGM